MIQRETNGGPLRPQGLGGQSYNCQFVPPGGYTGSIVPTIRFFGSRPVGCESLITSVAVNIGRTNDQSRERDRACQAYFGHTFQELQNVLSAHIPCRIGQVSQITCTDRTATERFVDLLIHLYQEQQQGIADTETSSATTAQDSRLQEDLSSPFESILDALDTEKINQEQERVLRLINERRGQDGFREKLKQAYGSRCAVTGCTLLEVLEAAHIIPCSDMKMDVVPNGLLLRADVHTLFDKGLLTITEKYCVRLHPSIEEEDYIQLDGRALLLPLAEVNWPNQKALQWHRERVFERR